MTVLSGFGQVWTHIFMLLVFILSILFILVQPVAGARILARAVTA